MPINIPELFNILQAYLTVEVGVRATKRKVSATVEIYFNDELISKSTDESPIFEDEED
jgi:hypothetical protein